MSFNVNNNKIIYVSNDNDTRYKLFPCSVLIFMLMLHLRLKMPTRKITGIQFILLPPLLFTTDDSLLSSLININEPYNVC